jgi:hypothetical protein
VNNILVDFTPLQYDPSLILETTQAPNGIVRIKGVLQRANTKNQNGRIYPKQILEREAAAYVQYFVKERRALGELDHPLCFRWSAKILLSSGWKFIKDISSDDCAYTLNINSGNIELQQITRKIDVPYTGKMISIKGKNIDVLVTPNHRFPIKDRNGNIEFYTAQEIFEISKITKNPHLSIPKTGTWIGNAMKDTFVIPSIVIHKGTHKNRDKQKTDLVLNTQQWFSFLGFYLAEGHVSNRSLRHSYGVFITQKNKKNIEDFRLVLNALSPELQWHEYKKTGDVGIIFSTHDARLWSYLSKLGNKYTKYIPQEIKDATPDLLQNLFTWFRRGDGSLVNDKGYYRETVFSVSQKLIYDLNEILIKLGKAGRIKTVIQKTHFIRDRLIKTENTKPLYRLWIEKSKNIHLDFRFLKVEEQEYNDRVYCVTVPNNTFYCEDHGKQFWSGNSEIVNLKNVSHNITELYWKGDDLCGTIEILSTPSGNIVKELMKNDIRLGVSSRGMGSVKQVDESTVEVADDFRLVCFDLVSNPSVPGAFLTEGHVPSALLLQETKINNLIIDFFTELNNN